MTIKRVLVFFVIAACCALSIVIGLWIYHVQATGDIPTYSFETSPDTPHAGYAIVAAARGQIGKTVVYDPAYVRMTYPMGDIPIEKGVCTDVVIRALRGALKMDLQQLMYEDVSTAYFAYPNKRRLQLPDKNIDHRRVRNLNVYFERKGFSLPISASPEKYLPGDLVTCLVGTLPHIMIVSDKKTPKGIPLVIHNIGSGAKEEDYLFVNPVTGHYRLTKTEK